MLHYGIKEIGDRRIQFWWTRSRGWDATSAGNVNNNGWMGGSWGVLNQNGVWNENASGNNVNNNFTLRPAP